LSPKALLAEELLQNSYDFLRVRGHFTDDLAKKYSLPYVICCANTEKTLKKSSEMYTAQPLSNDMKNACLGHIFSILLNRFLDQRQYAPWDAVRAHLMGDADTVIPLIWTRSLC
jgi:hypothetical protein